MSAVPQLTDAESCVLRQLAQKYMEIASLPIQNEKRILWQQLNRHAMQRPMLNMDQIPWHEMDVDGFLRNEVTDPYWRAVETSLRQTLYRFHHMPVDMVVEPYLILPRPIRHTGYGIVTREETRVSDVQITVVGHKFLNQFTDMADVARIQTPQVLWDREAETAIRQQAEVLFQGIAPVRMTGLTLHLGLWDFITGWMGVENIYIELMDHPELLHAIMQRLTDATEELIHQLNRNGLFDTYTHLCHCSYTYSDDLPTFSSDRDHPTSHDVWAFGLAQLFSSVSPQITAEFEVPYMQRLFPYFGAIYYGCCDRLDDRLDIVAQMPNIRKVSCSPFSHREEFAEKLPHRYIMSNKPNPSFLGRDSIDYEEIRLDLRRTIQAARSNGVQLELILKDISTVHYQPQRLWEWSRIALEEASR